MVVNKYKRGWIVGSDQHLVADSAPARHDSEFFWTGKKWVGMRSLAKIYLTEAEAELAKSAMPGPPS
jgi:hypothetical protein